MCSLIVASCIISSLLTAGCANEVTLLTADVNIVQYLSFHSPKIIVLIILIP